MTATAPVKLFDWQQEAVDGMASQATPLRACLYFKTGAGKTLTGLVGIAQQGRDAALVMAPPSTHAAWIHWGKRLGVEVTAISHAKFRQKDYKVSRDTALIVDEFHLLGGHGGKGWKKLDTMARHLTGPLILMSATPNYNDAERVYCIQHVLDPHSVKGGYLAFLYRECNTEQNPFGQEPLVDKDKPFIRFKDAAEYLAALPQVYYLPDDLVWSINDIVMPVMTEPAFEKYGYDRYTHRIMASIIEEKHRRIFNALVTPNGYIEEETYYVLEDLVGDSPTPVLIYANHSTVAEALSKDLAANEVEHALVTGKTPARVKEERISAFREGKLDVLVGTASLATGTDGIDKMCDRLIILDDTDDASLRRQLVGRIMPRGADADASKKQVFRIVLDWT